MLSERVSEKHTYGLFHFLHEAAREAHTPPFSFDDVHGANAATGAPRRQAGCVGPPLQPLR